MYFVLFSALIALDLMLLINYSLHIFMPLFNFQKIGWAYVVYVFGAPYLSPLIAISGAFAGSVRLLKYSSYMSSMTILANIPLSVIVGVFVGEDPVYWLLFCFIIIIKMGQSATGAKIRQYLANPRYKKNKEKLRKITKKQNEKMLKSEEILGRDTLQNLNLLDESTPTDVNDKLRDKLLE